MRQLYFFSIITIIRKKELKLHCDHFREISKCHMANYREISNGLMIILKSKFAMGQVYFLQELL